MIEQILEKSLKITNKVEIYCIEGRSDNISFENSILKDIGSNILSGISLRIIKDGIRDFLIQGILSIRMNLYRML